MLEEQESSKQKNYKDEEKEGEKREGKHTTAGNVHRGKLLTHTYIRQYSPYFAANGFFGGAEDENMPGGVMLVATAMAFRFVRPSDWQIVSVHIHVSSHARPLRRRLNLL